MGKFNESKLSEYKEGILGLYAERVRDVLNGNTSRNFLQICEMLDEALPFFPKNERETYKKFLDYGRTQFKLIQARHIVEAATDSEEERKKFIGELLKKNGY
ncbi:MAG: hypothetical protein NT120_04110 [Candidatus Aenigmarchaeota archaeon]|nr:hypothetical protein [Candidatus Aenigmarchaeota archaeon]